MSRTGIVSVLHRYRGMVAIKADDDGSYTIIEVLSSFHLELGDEVAWAQGYGLGSETFQNLTTGESDEVFVQNHSVAAENVRQQLLV